MSEEMVGQPERRVNFRLTNEEYDTMLRIADMLHKNGSLKINTVNALAKAACFTQINIYLGYEAKEKAFVLWQKEQKEAEKELKSKNMPPYDLPSGYNYPQGGY